MVFTALLIGALTAYYWGVEIGAVAAVCAAVAFAVALFMPMYALKIYAGVAIYGGFVMIAGPKIAPTRNKNKIQVSNILRSGHKQWRKWNDKFRK